MCQLWIYLVVGRLSNVWEPTKQEGNFRPLKYLGAETVVTLVISPSEYTL